MIGCKHMHPINKILLYFPL